MAYSVNRFIIGDNADPGQIIYDLAFTAGYLKRTHIWLYLNGEVRGGAGGVDADGFTWTTSSRVQLKDYTPVTGDLLEFRRIIPKTSQYVDFQDNAIINESMLDEAQLAILMISHEFSDGYGGDWTELTDWISQQATQVSADATAAADSQEAAALSETNAAASETAAAASEAAAASSEANAATSEANAATSETNAAASAAAALTSETNAAASETNAAASETAAAASAADANTSAVAAALSESNALASEVAAAESESNAADSETNAEYWAGVSEGNVVRGPNILLNPDMWVNQRTVSTLGSLSGYPVDRYSVVSAGSAYKTTNTLQFTPGASPVDDVGNYVQIITGTMNDANEYVMFRQKVPWVRDLAGRTLTWSFWLKTDVAGQVGVTCLQNFGTGGSDQVFTHLGDLTTTTGWTQHTVTFTVPSTSGKTIGTGVSFTEFRLWLSAGSDYSAYTSIGNQALTFETTAWKVEEGSVATPLGYIDHELELRKCMAFYEKSYNYGVAPGSAATLGRFQFHARSTVAQYASCAFSVPKITTPSVTVYSTTGAAGYCRVTSGDYTMTVGEIGFTSISAYTVGYSCAVTDVVSFQWTADCNL